MNGNVSQHSPIFFTNPLQQQPFRQSFYHQSFLSYGKPQEKQTSELLAMMHR